MKSIVCVLGLCAIGSIAWEFPPVGVDTHQLRQRPLSSEDDDVDIVSGSQFWGIKTFANLPYLNCVSDEETEDSKYDIAIVGAPFDTVRPAPPRRVGPQRYFADDRSTPTSPPLAGPVLAMAPPVSG